MGAIQIRRGIPNLATAEKTKKPKTPNIKTKQKDYICLPGKDALRV